MEAIAKGVKFIFTINRLVGKFAAWLTFLCVVVCASVAILRYFFNFGQIWMQELYVALFACSFMLIAGYVYACNQHVRVDILATRVKPSTKAWLEIFGVVFFLTPWLLLIMYYSLWNPSSFVRAAWNLGEASPLPGGLEGFYIIKAMIPAFAVFLLLQGFAAIGQSILIIKGREDLLPPRENLIPTSEGLSN